MHEDHQYLTLMREARHLAQRFVDGWPDQVKPADLPRAQVTAARSTLRKLAAIADALERLSGRTSSPSRAGTETAHVRDLDVEAVTPALEQRVGVTLDSLASWMALDGVKGFGPQKAKEIRRAGVRPDDLLRSPHLLPLSGTTGSRLIEAISSLQAEDRQVAYERAVVQMNRAAKYDALILTYDHPLYPQTVFDSNNPIPVLYARGRAEILQNNRTVACVGSRQIGGPYTTGHSHFAQWAAGQGWAIVSGFALGADTVGHEAAFRAGGATVCVMPGGLDRPFPPENRKLWEELLRSDSAVMISEFPFGVGASSMNLRKRNKLIVAAARGVLVSQSSKNGGAMNAFRFAVEQRKPVATFESDNHEATTGNQVIAEERKVPVRVFPLRDDQEGWNEWLQQLSSSI